MFQKKQKSVPPPKAKDVSLPTGSAIKTDSGWFYVKGNKKFRILSERILDSWKFERVIYVTESCAARYKTMGKLGFREGTVIEDIYTGEKFLISENKKRQITSPDVLTDLDITNIVTVSHEEAGIHVRGEDI